MKRRDITIDLESGEALHLSHVIYSGEGVSPREKKNTTFLQADVLLFKGKGEFEEIAAVVGYPENRQNFHSVDLVTQWKTPQWEHNEQAEKLVMEARMIVCERLLVER